MYAYEALGRVRSELQAKRLQIAESIIKGVEAAVNYPRLVGECAGLEYAIRELDAAILAAKDGA